MTKHDGHVRPARRPITVFGIAFGLLFLLMASFSVATPQGASPDEPAHAIRAYAAAHGELFGPDSASIPGTIDQTVSTYFAKLESHMPCFKRNVAVTPSCVAPVENQDAPTTGHTSTTVNTPVFYVLVGWPTAFLDGAKGLYGMRLVNALLCSALLALAFTALRALPRSRWALAGLAVGVTPMVLFLSGTLNPNGIEVAASAAAFALLLLTFGTPAAGSRLVLRILGIVAVSLLLVNTRSIAMLWLALAFVIAILLGKREVLRTVFRSWLTWAGIVVIGAVAVAAALFYLRPRSLTPGYAPVGAGSSWWQGFSNTLDGTFSFMIGWIAQFGWLEIPAPALTVAVWATVGGMVILLGSTLGPRTVKIGALLLGLAIVFVPPFSQAAVIHDAGYIWQGRYTIAPAVLLAVLAGIGLDHALPAADKRLTAVMRVAVVLLGIAQLAAFLWMLRRYVTGLQQNLTWIDMLRAPQWQPPGGWLLVTVVFAITTGLAVWLLIRTLSRTCDNGEPTEAVLPDRPSAPPLTPTPI